VFELAQPKQPVEWHLRPEIRALMVASQRGVDQEADEKAEELEGREAGAWHRFRGPLAAAERR
jgi:hypothetical protein